MLQLGVDFSQWNDNELTKEIVECWKGSGVRHAVVQYSSKMKQQLSALQAAQWMPDGVDAYVYLYWGVDPWGQTPMTRVANAINMMQGYPVQRLWLDAEDSTHPYDEAQLLACVDICNIRGIPCGIYTGRWWWEPKTHNSETFRNLPLWHAEYVTDRPEALIDLTEVNISGFKPYGGWDHVTLWQFHDTTTLCGYNVDLNAYEALDEEPEEVPTLPTYDAVTRSADQHFIEFHDVSGFVVYRLGSTDGSSGSRQSRPRNGNVDSADHWEWLRTESVTGYCYWSQVEGD